MRTEDTELVLAAIAYVEEVHKEILAENTAPPAGVEDQVVEAVLADPALSAYVRDWARRNREPEGSPKPPQRPPMDDAYRRVRSLLAATEGARAKS